MNKLFWIAAVFFACAVCRAGEEQDAVLMLNDVLERMPEKPIQVSGTITVRKRHGFVEKELRFDMRLRWGDVPAVAEYTIKDAFGGELERLTVIRAPGSPFEFEYAAGNPLAAADIPDLGAAVQGTDLSWLDLSLSFLWWRDAVITGSDVIRGRRCSIIEVRPPKSEKWPYSKVKLWIDNEIRMLLQAEAYGPDGNPLRRLWIKSVKKVEDRWMIKTMEVESYPTVQRTRLVISEADGVQF